MAAHPASHTACAWSCPSVDARSVKLASTTGVRCAVVQPVSMPPTRPRSTKATRHPASFNRRAAVMPVRPPPTTTASTSSEWRSAGNLGRSIWSHQGMGRKSFMWASHYSGRRSNCPAGRAPRLPPVGIIRNEGSETRRPGNLPATITREVPARRLRRSR